MTDSDIQKFKEERSKFFDILEKLDLNEKLLVINSLPENLPWPFHNSIADLLIQYLLVEKNFETAKEILHTIINKAGNIHTWSVIYKLLLRKEELRSGSETFDWKIYDYFLSIAPREILNYCRGDKSKYD